MIVSLSDQQFSEHVAIIAEVASQAVEESDAIERNPEVLASLHELSDCPQLKEHFPEETHPQEYLLAIADGLTTYLKEPLEDDPELVQSLGFIAWALQEQRSPEEVQRMLILA